MQEARRVKADIADSEVAQKKVSRVSAERYVADLKERVHVESRQALALYAQAGVQLPPRIWWR